MPQNLPSIVCFAFKKVPWLTKRTPRPPARLRLQAFLVYLGIEWTAWKHPNCPIVTTPLLTLHASYRILPLE